MHELEFDLVDGSDADEAQEFVAGDDQQAVVALRDSSPFCHVAVPAPTASGVLALLRRQEEILTTTRMTLRATPWEHLDRAPGNEEIMIGSHMRIYRKAQ